MDVEATTAVRQAEVTAAKTMIERTAERLEVNPSRLAAAPAMARPKCSPGWSTSAGSSHTSQCSTSRSVKRTDGTFSRTDSAYDAESDAYTCPAGKQLRKYHRPFAVPWIGVTKDNMVLYRASKFDCGACALKAKCCPNVLARKVSRYVHEAARDKARTIAK